MYTWPISSGEFQAGLLLLEVSTRYYRIQLGWIQYTALRVLRVAGMRDSRGKSIYKARNRRRAILHSTICKRLAAMNEKKPNSGFSTAFNTAIHFSIWLFAILRASTAHLLLVLAGILMRLLRLLLLLRLWLLMLRSHHSSMYIRAKDSKVWPRYNPHRSFQVQPDENAFKSHDGGHWVIVRASMFTNGVK